MNYIFADIETTGIDPYLDEIITAYFVITDCDLNIRNKYGIKIKPTKWSEDAERINGISKETASNFGSIQDGIREIEQKTPRDDKNVFICHANTSSNRGFVTFDYAFLKYLFFSQDKYFDFLKLFPKCISTIEIAKQKEIEGKFNAPTKLIEVNRKGTLKQQSRKTYALKPPCEHFGVTLDNHHDAKSDTIACFELYKKLVAL